MHCRQTSLRRIARWVTQLVGHVDLTPSDIVLALILTATLQRKRRRYAHPSLCSDPTVLHSTTG